VSIRRICNRLRCNCAWAGAYIAILPIPRGEPPEKKAGAAPAEDGWTKSLRLLRRVLMSLLASDAASEQRPFADGPIADIELARAEFYKSYPADGDAGTREGLLSNPSRCPVQNVPACGTFGDKCPGLSQLSGQQKCIAHSQDVG
jgi:hypothetical protein